MSSIDETSEVIYVSVQALNSNQTNSMPQLCTIKQESNAILDNIGDYNIYVQSITFTSANIPYCCLKRNIMNFQNNQLNYSISITGPTGQYPFTIDTNDKLLIGINSNGSGKYQGITCFLQFFSENVNQSRYPNPNPNGYINTGFNSQNYPREYFNLIDLDHFMQMINNAINKIIGCWESSPIGANSLYFSYNPTNQLYQLTMPSAFYSGSYALYVNTFLQRILDGFRWVFYNYGNISTNSYTGLDWALSKYNYPNNLQSGNWTYTAKYSTICNIVDIHSMLLVANSGDLTNIVPSFVPTSSYNPSNPNAPSLAVLKSLDFDYTSFNLNQVNNCYVEYQATGLFFPLNTTSIGELRNIFLQLYCQDTDNTIYPLQLPAGGYCNIRLACKKKIIQ
jgi:hypothetical protein